MKVVKSFVEYVSELRESQKILTESLLDKVKLAFKKIGDFFKGTGAWFINALISQTSGKLTKGVILYPSSFDIHLLKSLGEDIKIPSIKESEDLPFSQFYHLNEGAVDLKHPNPKVPNVGSEELQERIKDVIEGGEKGPKLLIWGAPGIGKTAIVNAIAELYWTDAVDQKRIIECQLSSMLPEDFFIPAVRGDANPKAIDVPKDWLPVYRIGDPDGDSHANGPDGKGGILFLDELTRARPAVQDVCLKLVLERKVANFKLGSKWVIVAAANRQGDDDTGTYNFSTALGNRFDQVNYHPKFEEWQRWAATAKDKDGNFLVNPDILAFVNFNKKWFYNLDPQESAEIFASPRQWTEASKHLLIRLERAKKAGKSLSDDDMESIVAGKVGTDAASSFMGFLKLSRQVDLKDMEKVYTDPDKAPMPPKGDADGFKPELAYAMLSAIAFNKRDEKLTPKDVTNFFKYVCKLKQAPWAAKLASLLKDVHPEVATMESWNEGLNSFYDAYPSLSKEKKAS